MRRILSIILVLAACSDPSGPQPNQLSKDCSGVYACRVPGIDVQVVSLELSATRHDPATGLAIIHPDSIQLSYTLRNIGSDTAKGGSISLWLEQGSGDFTGYYRVPAEMPVLAPGAEWRFSGMVVIPTGEGTRLFDDRVYLKLTADMLSDADFTNNIAHSPLFHLAKPLIDITYTIINSTVIAGDSVQLDVVARNYGTHAGMPASSLAACLYEGFAGCSPSYRTIAGSVNMPAVPAGGVVRFAATVAIPHTAAWQDLASTYSMYLCAPPAAGSYYTEQPSCASNGMNITVLPDYTRCGPPVVPAGTTMNLSGYNCGLRPALGGYEQQTAQHRFHLVALDAQAGVTYDVQRSDSSAPLRIYNSAGRPINDLDGSANRIRIASTERIYLVSYSATPALTIGAVVNAEVVT